MDLLQSFWLLMLVSAQYCCLSLAQGHTLEYPNAILEARCGSRCLELYGDPPSQLYNVYTSKICHNTNCQQCTKACGDVIKIRVFKPCHDVCTTTRAPLVCQQSCEFIRSLVKETDTFNVPGDTSQVSISEPVVACLYTNDSAEAGNTHVSTVYLKWDVHKHRSYRLPQLQFVISLQRLVNDSGDSAWIVIGKTGYSFVPIQNLTMSTTYRFRVTAVSEHGAVHDPQMTDWITTLPDNYIPRPPAHIRINRQTLYNEAVSVEVSWDAASDKSCFYKIYWLPTCKQSKRGDYVVEEIKTPPDFIYWMSKLQFDCNYTVSIYSFPTPSFTRGSTAKRVSFLTLECLNATDYNYSVCKPEVPVNLSVIKKEWYLDDNHPRGNTTLEWDGPAHESLSNKLTGYLLQWSKALPIRLGPHESPDKGIVRLPPNVSSYAIPGMHWNNRYLVEVRAVSPGGTSDYISTIVELGAVDYSDTLTNVTAATILDVSGDIMTGATRGAGDAPSSGKPYITFGFCEGHRVIIGSAIGVCVVLTTIGTILVRYTTRRKRAYRIQRGVKIEETNPLYDNAYAINGCDEYEQDFSSLVLLKNVGEGAFGKVVKAELLVPGKDDKEPTKVIAAVKMLKGDTMTGATCGAGDAHSSAAPATNFGFCEDHPDVTERRSLLKEIESMKQLGHHPNIVSIIGCCTTSDRICLIMDYCPLGDLRQYLHGLRPQTQYHESPLHRSADSGIVSNMTEVNDSGYQPITQTTLLSYARQIVTGMEYLTEKKYVHRDLAARNILMFDVNRLKISDFGLTRDVYETNMYQPTSARKLPYKWMALEAISDQIFTTMADVWSFGIVLWEIVTLGGSPYPGIPNEDLFRLLKDGYRMENPGNCSSDIYQIMLSCWHPRPLSRPSFSDLHTTFESMQEMTKAYINLSVSVSDDYYNSDSLSGRGNGSNGESEEPDSDTSYTTENKYNKNLIFSTAAISEPDLPLREKGGYSNIFVNERNEQHNLMCDSMCRFCSTPPKTRRDTKLHAELSSNLYEEPISLMSSVRNVESNPT